MTTIYNPENQYPKGTPFTYLIGWSELNKFYYGVKFNKNCHPNDLWTTYFTSSKSVKEFRTLNGEPDIIKVDFVYNNARESREYEEKFLRDNNCVKDSKWLNLCNGGKDFCVTEESIKKSADSQRGRIYINNGINEKRIKPEFLQDHLDLGWVSGRLPKSAETKQKISDSNRGFTHSDESKKKMSDARRGKSHTEEAKKKIADANIGKTHTEETKQKIKDAAIEICKNPEYIQKQIDSHKGKTHSEETKQKMRKPKSAETKQKMAMKKCSAESIKKRIETRKRNRLSKIQTLENCF